MKICLLNAKKKKGTPAERLHGAWLGLLGQGEEGKDPLSSPSAQDRGCSDPAGDSSKGLPAVGGDQAASYMGVWGTVGVARIIQPPLVPSGLMCTLLTGSVFFLLWTLGMTSAGGSPAP